jgi:DNA-binding MarR family transcriptional regulator
MSDSVLSETPWLTDDEQRTWRSFMLATQLIDEALDRQLQRDANMPHAYYGILVALSEAPEQTLRMTDLARHLRYSQSRMTHAIASMERSGWAKRRSCPTDGRSQLVGITPKGAEVLRDAAVGHVAEVRSVLFDRLSDEQVEQLGTICSALLADSSGPERGDRQPL